MVHRATSAATEEMRRMEEEFHSLSLRQAREREQYTH